MSERKRPRLAQMDCTGKRCLLQPPPLLALVSVEIVEIRKHPDGPCTQMGVVFLLGARLHPRGFINAPFPAHVDASDLEVTFYWPAEYSGQKVPRWPGEHSEEVPHFSWLFLTALSS